MRRILTLIALLAAPALAPSAALADDTDDQAWLNVTAQQRLSGKLLLWAEVQGRFGEDASRLTQSIIRPGLGYEVSPKVQLWAGYGYITNHAASGPDQTEDRLWQQASWTVGKVAGGTFSSRSRLEQRWVDGGDDTGWRVRQFFKYDRPLKPGGDASLVLTSETFVATNDADWGARSGFDQMRNFAGVGFSVAPKARLEIGYLNQFINRTGSNDRINHIASVSLLKRL